MAFAASLTELHTEATCPLCLDYLRDAVTVDCGHNFCGPCIQERWKYVQDVFPCPVCLHHCPDGITKKNAQLSYITDIVKQLPTGSNKRKRQEEEPMCKKHNEVLDLFCEEDSELLCPQCRASSDHQFHHLMPTRRAVVSQRKKLKSCMELLKKRIDDAKREHENQLTKCMEGRWKIEKQKVELQLEFEQFKSLLKREEISIIATLFTEENIIENKLTQNKSSISNRRETLKNLLSEMREKFLQADQNLLASIKSTHSQFADLPPLTVLTYELKKKPFTLPSHYFGLHKMISTFQENLTLDPETAHPNLVVSKDRKGVTFGTRPTDLAGNPQERIPYLAVLCCENFQRGRHFWQIEVKGNGELSLGVCKETCENTLMPSISENDLWQFSQTFRTFGDTWNIEQEEIRRIGVFLDIELGELSFYNLKSRSCLHKMTRTFPESVTPFFAFGLYSHSLMIQIVTEQ